MNKYLLEDRNCISKTATKLGFKDKSFLISGATGMIGQILVNAILTFTEPKKVYVMGKDLEECQSVYPNSGVNYIGFETLDSVKGNIDYVIHLASPTNSQFLANNPVEVIDFMYNSTKQLLEFSKAHNSSMLFISSMEAFGEVFDDDKKLEKDLGYLSLESTRSSYPETKRLCELLVKSYSQEYSLNCYSARLAQTFGAGTSLNDPRVFGYFARCVMNKEDIVLRTKGETFGNYCYVSDVIEAFFYILANGTRGETYNVVGDNTRSTIVDMANMVKKEFADNMIEVKFDIAPEGIYPKPTQLNMDNSKIKKLGWSPKYSLFDMYKRMLGY